MRYNQRGMSSEEAITRSLTVELDGLPVEVLADGTLQFMPGSTEEEDLEIMQRIRRGGKISACVRNFAEGDTWNRITKRYGNGIASLAKVYPPEALRSVYGHARECGYVASKWLRSQRDYRKGWKWHKENRPYNPDAIPVEPERLDKPIVGPAYNLLHFKDDEGTPIPGVFYSANLTIIERDGCRALLASTDEVDFYRSDGWNVVLDLREIKPYGKP